MYHRHFQLDSLPLVSTQCLGEGLVNPSAGFSWMIRHLESIDTVLGHASIKPSSSVFVCFKLSFKSKIWHGWSLRISIVTLVITRNASHNLFLLGLPLPGKSQFHFLMQYSILFWGHFKFLLLCLLQYENDWIMPGPGLHIPMWLIAAACGRSPYRVCNLRLLICDGVRCIKCSK